MLLLKIFISLIVKDINPTMEMNFGQRVCVFKQQTIYEETQTCIQEFVSDAVRSSNRRLKLWERTELKFS